MSMNRDPILKERLWSHVSRSVVARELPLSRPLAVDTRNATRGLTDPSGKVAKA